MTEFKVGDKVVLMTIGIYDSYQRGEIISISPKRGDLTVRFSNNQLKKFSSGGHSRGSNVWSMGWLMVLTPDLEKSILDGERTVEARYTIRKFAEKVNRISDVDFLEKVAAVINSGWKNE